MKLDFISMTKISFIVLLSFLFACKAQTVKSGQWPNHRITFGNNGGFTGAQQRFVLFENGQLFYISGTDTAEQDKVKRKQIKAIFAEIEKVKATNFLVDRVGNMTNFIEYQKDNEVLLWQWPTGGFKSVPDSISVLNQLLSNAVQPK